ncbi:hypothetical protein [Hydrogenimonas urashimensis]|uniref:hypothetical protein n=1 Tax=Hydrogenimonas urashimensis TaxID=2740515 RepID=UPI00191556EF|nr:hypothetical protein [Hydrogenimonas urashimensis]
MLKILPFYFMAALLAGLFRYWFGFFPLAHALFLGLGSAWFASLFYRQERTAGKRTVFAILATLLVGELAGFGMAQPWFDPLGWLSRVLQSDTTEEIFGLALMGGRIGRNFQLGTGGGFWVLFNLIDALFLLFFVMTGVNTFVYRKRG